VVLYIIIIGPDCVQDAPLDHIWYIIRESYWQSTTSILFTL